MFVHLFIVVSFYFILGFVGVCLFVVFCCCFCFGSCCFCCCFALFCLFALFLFICLFICCCCSSFVFLCFTCPQTVHFFPSLSLMCKHTTNLMPQTCAVHTRKLMTKTCVCTQDRSVTVKLMPHVCIHATMVMPDMPVCVHAAKIMPHACAHTTTFNATDFSLFTINEKYMCSDFTLRTQCQMHVFTQRGLMPWADLSLFSIRSQCQIPVFTQRGSLTQTRLNSRFEVNTKPPCSHCQD